MDSDIKRNPYEYLAPFKALYNTCIEPVCRQFGLSRTELDILLFLSHYPEQDTAAEITAMRYLTKSHVSTSLRHLQELDYVRPSYAVDNHKLVHLGLSGSVVPIIAAGKEAQKKFASILFEGMETEEIERIEAALARAYQNVCRYRPENDGAVCSEE